MKEEHSLKELVVKLNDRNIQRQRESGLTVYVILAITIAILFYLIENAAQFFKIDLIQSNLIVLGIVGDIAFVLTLCVAYFAINNEIRVTKIFVSSNFLSEQMLSPLMLLVGIITCLNIYASIFSQSELTSLIYLLFATILAANIVFPFGVEIYKWWLNRRETSETPAFTYFRNEARKSLRWGAFLYFVALSIPALLLVFNESLPLDDLQKISAVKYSIFILGLFIAFNKLVMLKDQLSERNNLEELEKEIYLKNLSNKEIKLRLESEYFGQDFKDWCEFRKDAFSQYFENAKQTIMSITSRIPEITNGSIALAERRSVYENIHSIRENLVKDLNIQDQKFVIQIKHLRKYSSIQKDELYCLEDLQNWYSKCFEEFKSVDDPLYDFFVGVQKNAGKEN